MAYTKVGPWNNGSTPALSAANLDTMEAGIYEAHNKPNATWLEWRNAGNDGWINALRVSTINSQDTVQLGLPMYATKPVVNTTPSFFVVHNLETGAGVAGSATPAQFVFQLNATDVAPVSRAYAALSGRTTVGTPADVSGATGSALGLHAEVVVHSSGNVNNEYAPYYGAIKVQIGTGFNWTTMPGRVWFGDYNIHGPVGVQPGLLTGITMFMNNHFNGAPSAGPSYAFAAVTHKGRGGGAPGAVHLAAETYPHGYGFGVFGVATAGNLRGWEVGVRVGGGTNHSGWDVDSTRVGTAFYGTDFDTVGVDLVGAFAAAVALRMKGHASQSGNIAEVRDSSDALRFAIGPQGAPFSPPYTVGGTSHTFVAANAGALGRFTSSSAVAITIPTNASVPYPIGTTLPFVQAGTGQLTVSGAGGVTVNTRGGRNKTAEQGAAGAAHKVGTNEWDLYGAMTT